MTGVRIDRRQMLLTSCVATALLAAPRALAAQVQTSAEGRRQPFDGGWLFRRGVGEGQEAPRLDDRDWRALDLPHDWSIEDLPARAGEARGAIGPFDPKAEGGTSTGFTVGGEGWYRKHFRLARPTTGRVELTFDGVYMDSQVWLNGEPVGAHFNGYTPFALDLTPYLSADGENVLAVRVRNLGLNSRWYSGSGIYRHVWLDVLPEQARIARWGVSVSTRRLTSATAELDLGVRLEAIDAGCSVNWRVRDPQGRVAAQAQAHAVASADLRHALTLKAPRAWSPDTPVLYTLETELRRGDVVLDRDVTRFGVRVISFDTQDGMLINGAPYKLRGGCIHHDHGVLGAAAFDRAEDRKVRLLKARGYNAVRPSHNLFSPAFLEACDRHGMLVVCETFDVWRRGKKAQDYAVQFDALWRSDLDAIVRSARNHPSIVMWSIGNEIPDRNTPQGVEIQWRLANAVHELDPTRPVTAGLHEFLGRPVTPSAATARRGKPVAPDQTSTVFLDVVGYNYKLRDYEADHQAYPDRVLYGTESYPKDVFETWALTNRSPWLIGDFVWTAMDHLGEVGIGGSALLAKDAKFRMAPNLAWPWISNNCGDIDLIGDQKAPSHARDVVWGVSELEMAVQRPLPEGKDEVLRLWGWSDELQSWTWPGADGAPMTIRVYTRGDRVDLRLNGRLVETKAVGDEDQWQVAFTTPYAPGVLEAVCYRQGRELARKRLATVGAPKMIRLRAEDGGQAGRGEVSFVKVEIVDAEGRAIPELARAVRLSVTGPADLIGFGGGDPQARGGYQSPSALTFNARALAVLRGRGRAGSVTLTARADGLPTAKLALRLT
ncbi:glycoside hydrolase family 2 TIM barrel-domain containing protein [Caulobacter sp. LARHSG274]